MRGFGLSDDDVLALLVAWSADQAWDREWLLRKIQSAHAFGHEPVGGRL